MTFEEAQAIMAGPHVALRVYRNGDGDVMDLEPLQTLEPPVPVTRAEYVVSHYFPAEFGRLLCNQVLLLPVLPGVRP